MTRYLITGAEGFVGRILTGTLLAQTAPGDHLTLIDRELPTPRICCTVKATRPSFSKPAPEGTIRAGVLEQWTADLIHDLGQTIPARSEWQNGNGKF